MTDNELRKEILLRVYNRGVRYVARDLSGEIYAYEEKPEFDNDGCWWDVSEDLTKVIVELTYLKIYSQIANEYRNLTRYWQRAGDCRLEKCAS